MEKMRDWFGTPRKAMNTFIWLCFVSLLLSIGVLAATLLSAALD